MKLMNNHAVCKSKSSTERRVTCWTGRHNFCGCVMICSQELFFLRNLPQSHRVKSYICSVTCDAFRSGGHISQYSTVRVSAHDRCREIHNRKGGWCYSIIQFYQDDLDADRLILHRKIFLDIARQRGDVLASFHDAFHIFCGSNQDSCWLLELLLELSKLFCWVLTIPVTTCTAERSF